jgi:hypothetical protein
MNLTEFQNLVTGYYLFENMPDNVGDNWDRYIATDGRVCTEVEYDYVPKENEMVFFCKIFRGETDVVLYKSGEKGRD